MSPEEYTLAGLFLSALLSSTILPGSSEAVLITLAMQGTHDPWSLFWVATGGNTVGGMTSWGLGILMSWGIPLTRGLKSPTFPATNRLRRWGLPVLLFSWIPFVGDPMCVAAGWLRMNGWGALLFIGVGKGARYAALLAMM